MTDRIKEQLSTFLDGELPEPESALLLKRLERDDELRGALSRYSLIGAVLRSDGDVPAARQVAARVSAAIAREPARVVARLRMPGRDVLMRSVSGLAIAAGVAFGSVLLVQQLAVQDSTMPEAVMAELVESPVVPVADEEETLAASYITPPAADGPVGLPPAELANYLVAHYGYASPLVRRSVGAGLISASHATALVDVPPEVSQAGR